MRTLKLTVLLTLTGVILFAESEALSPPENEHKPVAAKEKSESASTPHNSDRETVIGKGTAQSGSQTGSDSNRQNKGAQQPKLTKSAGVDDNLKNPSPSLEKSQKQNSEKVATPIHLERRSAGQRHKTHSQETSKLPSPGSSTPSSSTSEKGSASDRKTLDVPPTSTENLFQEKVTVPDVQPGTPTATSTQNANNAGTQEQEKMTQPAPKVISPPNAASPSPNAASPSPNAASSQTSGSKNSNAQPTKTALNPSKSQTDREVPEVPSDTPSGASGLNSISI